MHTVVFQTADQSSEAIARELANTIRMKHFQGRTFVLGIAAGSGTRKVLQQLVALHRQERLSFSNVVVFSLDEYYPMRLQELQSRSRYLQEQLLSQVDIPRQHIHTLDTVLPMEEVPAFCEEYERRIRAMGGLDTVLLDLGDNGHIAFNEPGTHVNAPTRMIALDHLTRKAHADTFGGLEGVPTKAIAMGVETLLSARRIILTAWGKGKAFIAARTAEEEASPEVPATYLQRHPNATLAVDKEAASQLVREKTPWLVGPCRWDDHMMRRAVVWLCLKLDKPILKLTDRDYNEHGLSDLRAAHGSAYDINIRLFNVLQHTITGWPGGKPNADDSHRPERALPAQKRVLVFSPHPDDDAISMGGTLIRLVDQGHEVHVAYQTSGNIAVSDSDVVRTVDALREIAEQFMDVDQEVPGIFYEKIIDYIAYKQEGDVDTPTVRGIKSVIRRSEARAACREMGIPPQRAYFLNMPFYETGQIQKLPLGEQDIDLMVEVLERVQPQQIYAAGDLADPHGTHGACLQALLVALERLKGREWLQDCRLWLYRGVWMAWDVEDVDMAVPLSPQEVLRKRQAIFKHQTQKDGISLPGADHREFWQRAEQHNRDMAGLYNRLGLAEYEAIEAFKRYRF